jgi:hypothetical protein
LAKAANAARKTASAAIKLLCVGVGFIVRQSPTV